MPRAAKVSEAAAGVERVEAVPSSASEDVDVGGGWRVVGGRVVRKVEVVSRLDGPIGRARTAGLLSVVEKVHALVRCGSVACSVSTKVWSQHRSDEILWAVTGMDKMVGNVEVLERLRVGVEATVGTEEVVCW